MLSMRKYALLAPVRMLPRFGVRWVSTGQRERVVVVGAGWAGFMFLRSIDRKKYDVTCVSPRNHFLFTPLLPSTAVGTLEFRSIIEPVRTLRGVRYLQAECEAIDTAQKTLHCRDAFGARAFSLPYDQLVMACGATNNTFGVKGVHEHAYFLKELPDARRIRNRVLECFERAACSTTTSPQEREALTRFVIVGGGPTCVEFAGELHDFIEQDVKKWFPDVPYQIVLVEAMNHILGTFDRRLSEVVVRLFRRRRVRLLTGTAVKEVQQKAVLLSDGSTIQCGLVVWSTGVAPNPLVKKLKWTKDLRSGRLCVNDYLQVLDIESIKKVKATFSCTGQCATKKNAGVGIADAILCHSTPADATQIAAAGPPCSCPFADALAARRPQSTAVTAPGAKTAAAVAAAGAKEQHGRAADPAPSAASPSPAANAKAAAEKALREGGRWMGSRWSAFVARRAEAKEEQLNEMAVRTAATLGAAEVLAKVDVLDGVYALGDCAVPFSQNLPALAQVAMQQGKYLADQFNARHHALAVGRKPSPKPFLFFNFGQLLYIGGYRSLAQMGLVRASGVGAFFFWRSAYFTRLVSWKNRLLVLMFWLKSFIFGRDISRF